MISIIVPIYNVEKYLSRCIESILNQTYKNIELILVDDGSPDNSPQICDHYANVDDRVCVIHQCNAGVSVARNAGLKIAKGQYIGFVDPDDWVAPEMYESMLDEIENVDTDLVICGYNYYDEEGNVDTKRLYQIRENEFLSQKDVMSRFFDMPPTIRHGVVNKLFKKSLLDELFFVEGLHSSEDVMFLDEYVLKTQNAVMVHRPYYKNTVRHGSATHGGLNIESLAASFKAHDKMYTDTIRRYPELKNHSLAFVLDVCTLKYNEAKKQCVKINNQEKISVTTYLTQMKRYIKKNAIVAILNKEIYWKTRIYYLLLR